MSSLVRVREDDGSSWPARMLRHDVEGGLILVETVEPPPVTAWVPEDTVDAAQPSSPVPAASEAIAAAAIIEKESTAEMNQLEAGSSAKSGKGRKSKAKTKAAYVMSSQAHEM